ncbi:MAG: N-6 DNA methylase [Mycoplasma sp.]|nr:N-6 DNA methylase [Mycoplasma sp.]
MHVILGILSLKYISDKYDNAIKKLNNSMKLELISPDMFYSNFDSFKVPEKAHWKNIMKFASSSEIGQKMDEAFIELEEKNPMLRGIFNKNYNSEGVDQNRLGEVVKIFSDEDFTKAKEDLIGRIYEYFLGNFFKDRGQKGGEFYTPQTIVKLIVNLITPLSGTIYDPACGTGGMLIQAKRFIQSHGGNIDNVSVYGQEFNNVTWKLAKLNLILNGFPLIDNDDKGVLGDKSADTFTKDQHRDSKFDYIMANPPFNLKNWGRESLEGDSRWKWGVPPKGNANYAWLSHIVSKLSINGKAGVVLANGSLSSSGKEELAIRKSFIENNKVDAIIALPDKLFYTVGIPACIWIFNNNKKDENILMVDASKLEGKMLSKKLRELTAENINQVQELYKEHLEGKNVEKIGFAKTITKEDLIENNFSFVPGRYVGFEEEVIDKEKTKEEIKNLANELSILFKEFEEIKPKVEESIKKALELEED